MRKFDSKKLGAVLIASSLAVGGIAFAGPGAGGGRGEFRQKMLEKFDRNGDGQLDEAERQEARAFREARRAERQQEMLAKFDTNRDGKLDDAERKVARDQRREMVFKKIDTDGNGVISLEEFKAAEMPRGKHGRKGKHGGM